MKILLMLSITLILLQSKTYFGTVIGVTDGDSIVVLTVSNKQIKVRLEGIDCPELGQDFGEEAKQVTVGLCFKMKVRIEETGKDRFGRTLAFVFVNEVCLNKELLKEGMAWHYKKYNHNPDLASLEEEARSKKVGLWSQISAAPPCDFRNKK